MITCSVEHNCHTLMVLLIGWNVHLVLGVSNILMRLFIMLLSKLSRTCNPILCFCTSVSNTITAGFIPILIYWRVHRCHLLTLYRFGQSVLKRKETLTFWVVTSMVHTLYWGIQSDHVTYTCTHIEDFRHVHTKPTLVFPRSQKSPRNIATGKIATARPSLYFAGFFCKRWKNLWHPTQIRLV